MIQQCSMSFTEAWHQCRADFAERHHQYELCVGTHVLACRSMFMDNVLQTLPGCQARSLWCRCNMGAHAACFGMSQEAFRTWPYKVDGSRLQSWQFLL